MAHRSRYVPPEHGAWAMLLVPFALGTFSATPSWWSLLLLTAWLAAYLTSYFALRWWKTRKLAHRGRRFRAPAIGYATLLLVSGSVLVVLRALAPRSGYRLRAVRGSGSHPGGARQGAIVGSRDGLSERSQPDGPGGLPLRRRR